MLGNVSRLRHVSCPPMHQATPRFSIRTSHRAAEFAAVALVNESPTAATTSISPEVTILLTQKVIPWMLSWEFYAQQPTKQFGWATRQVCTLHSGGRSWFYPVWVDGRWSVPFDCAAPWHCMEMRRWLAHAAAKTHLHCANRFRPVNCERIRLVRNYFLHIHL